MPRRNPSVKNRAGRHTTYTLEWFFQVLPIAEGRSANELSAEQLRVFDRVCEQEKVRRGDKKAVALFVFIENQKKGCEWHPYEFDQAYKHFSTINKTFWLRHSPERDRPCCVRNHGVKSCTSAP